MSTNFLEKLDKIGIHECLETDFYVKIRLSSTNMPLKRMVSLTVSADMIKFTRI